MSNLFGNNNETNDKWLEIADKIKIEYNEIFDYHPQFAGYERGTEVKQADAILIGYPLLYEMKNTTRRNDLNFYANVTRKSGPAMTNSMFAINYLDIDDVDDANEMLEMSYKPYIRSPFNVWNEAAEGIDGYAGNFITGAGGFLQTIFNGFFGMRIHLEYLEVRKPQLAGNVTRMRVCGIKYLKSTFELTVNKKDVGINFTKLSDPLNLLIENGTKIKIQENFECKLNKFFISLY